MAGPRGGNPAGVPAALAGRHAKEDVHVGRNARRDRLRPAPGSAGLHGAPALPRRALARGDHLTWSRRPRPLALAAPRAAYGTAGLAAGPGAGGRQRRPRPKPNTGALR